MAASIETGNRRRSDPERIVVKAGGNPRAAN